MTRYKPVLLNDVSVATLVYIIFLVTCLTVQFGVFPLSSSSNLVRDHETSRSSPYEKDRNEIACPTRCLSKHSSTNRNKKSRERILYLILIHNERTAHDAVNLFRSIRDPNNIILFHIDKKSANSLMPNVGSSRITNNDSNEFENLFLWEEVEACPCGSKIVIDSIYSIKWGQWSMTLPTLWAIEQGVNKYAGEWDVFINLSGDTLPVYSPEPMSKLLFELQPYNFITSKACETALLPTNVYTFPPWWHKRKHYTADGTEAELIFQYYDDNNRNVSRNKTIVTHFGSQWVILRPSFCEWLINQLRSEGSWPSQYRDYLIETKKLMSDETFVPTVLMHADQFKETIPRVVRDEVSGHDVLLYFNGTVSNIQHVRYERMDEHMPSSHGIFPSFQRYEVPKSLHSVVDVPRVWGPYYLGVYDLSDIRDSGSLFIRKVSSFIDPNMLAIFPVNKRSEIPVIRWPDEVVMSQKIDWEQRLMEAERKISGEEGIMKNDDEEL